MSLETFREARQAQLAYTNRALENRCRPLRHFEVWAREIRDRAGNLQTWHRRHEAAQGKSSLCLPTSPAAIIRYVFPSSTEDAAVRVASCESNLYTYARNPSGASGLFQLMPVHWQGNFDPFDPWANTRYAYRLSSGGTNWGSWVCKP